MTCDCNTATTSMGNARRFLCPRHCIVRSFVIRVYVHRSYGSTHNVWSIQLRDPQFIIQLINRKTSFLQHENSYSAVVALPPVRRQVAGSTLHGGSLFAKYNLTCATSSGGTLRWASKFPHWVVSLFAKNIRTSGNPSYFRAGAVAHCAKKGGAGRLGKAQPCWKKKVERAACPSLNLLSEPELWYTMHAVN
jgi:hypothetical protein